MVEFTVPSTISDRHVACRLSMIAGVSGPLAWDDQDDSLISIPHLLNNNPITWDLGMGFTLTIMSESDTSRRFDRRIGGNLPRTYKLTHNEIDSELHGMRPFLEWIIINHR